LLFGIKYCESFIEQVKHFKRKNLILQCVEIYNSLAVYLNDTKKHFDRFEKTVKDMLPDVDYKGTTIRRRNEKLG